METICEGILKETDGRETQIVRVVQGQRMFFLTQTVGFGKDWSGPARGVRRAKGVQNNENSPEVKQLCR